MTELNRYSVFEALSRIRPFVHRTPVYRCKAMNDLIDADVFFKCENFQKVGAFKARGAMNAVLSLDDSTYEVVTHSSGNHGAALAWAARQRDKKAFVIAPSDTSPFKRDSMTRYGAEIIECGEDLESREETTKQFLAKHDAEFISPYDDERVIAGQGTVTLEMIGRLPKMDQIWLPVGGGGLASGSVIASDGEVEIVGVEPELACDAYESMRSGKREPARPPVTIADGLRASLGELTFQILHDARVQIALASEDGIRDAMKLVWECMKIVIEPSSAVTIAAMLQNPAMVSRRVGVILSGGNVAFPSFEHTAERKIA